MQKATRLQRSPLGLVVLWMLVEGPKHVYRIQKLIEQQGKDRVVNVRARANLYQTIQRQVRLGLAEVRETVRTEGYPDRIVYAITDRGRQVAVQWLREMLNTTGEEFPDFMVAVSMLFGLEPEDARAQLERRTEKLTVELADAEAQLRDYPWLPRLFLLEEEYRRAVLTAELSWLGGIVDDLREGRLTWSEHEMREAFDALNPPHIDEEDG